MTAEQVLLGVLDASCPTVQISPLDSKIGGLPDCYKGCPITTLPSCKVCSSLLHLLAQVYCPQEGSPYHRLLHVFCCLQLQCQGNTKSWVVLRSQEREQEVTVAIDKPAAKLMDDKWCDDEDDWGNLSSLSLKDNGSLSKGSHLDLTKKESSKDGQPVHVETDQVEQLSTSNYIPSHYICVIEEPDDQLVAHNDKELARRVDGAIAHSDSSSEVYEKTLTKHGDKTFYKFYKRISKRPEQVLRYQWNGIPLLVTDSAVPLSPPSCQYCGSPRVFELQLMAPLIYLLKIRSKVVIEFGTVIVYTCSKSCWQDGNGFREEFTCLLPGPDDSQLTKLLI